MVDNKPVAVQKTFTVIIEEMTVPGAPGMDAMDLYRDIQNAYRPSMTDMWYQPKVISVTKVDA